VSGPACSFELFAFFRRRFDRLRPRSPSARGHTLAVHHELESYFVAKDRIDALLTLPKPPQPFAFINVHKYPPTSLDWRRDPTPAAI